MTYPRVSSLKTPADFQTHLAAQGIFLAFDEKLETGPEAPLARPCRSKAGIIGNRFAILPMEGWDSTSDGSPSELTRRRWHNFGISGAKLIWGGEAVAVCPEGRGSPHELCLHEENLADFAALREHLLAAHRERFGRTDDLLLGLQLTHSGRFSRPNQKTRPEPRILYRHPYLDEAVGVRDNSPVLLDKDVDRIIVDFVRAARMAERAGFAFVDVKHCHGYLGHEFLSAVDRPGRYGGSFENRTRFLREAVAGIRAEAPSLAIGVRLSLFDFIPFRPGPDGIGVPAATGKAYPYGFGGDGTGLGIDVAEPSAFLDLLSELGIELVCSSAGSPYYNPHIQRPAAFPPCDGYQPPEDPLAGVARQIAVAAALKARHPRMLFIGAGYSYLQEWLPHVGQRVLRDGGADFIGLGRMVLAYPDLPADVLAGRPLARKRICRTFSDCTTAPRNGLVSGCYPLDPFYKEREEARTLALVKRKTKHP